MNAAAKDKPHESPKFSSGDSGPHSRRDKVGRSEDDHTSSSKYSQNVGNGVGVGNETSNLDTNWIVVMLDHHLGSLGEVAGHFLNDRHAGNFVMGRELEIRCQWKGK